MVFGVGAWVARIMLLCSLWAALPLVVLGQTYYINFVFNNYRYPNLNGLNKSPEVSKEIDNSDNKSDNNADNNKPSIKKGEETVEAISTEKSEPESRSDSNEKGKNHEGEDNVTVDTFCKDLPSNTDEECEDISKSFISSDGKQPINREPTTNTIRTTTESDTAEAAEPIEITTSNWLAPTPHPDNFFDYPEAKCHEDMNLHELFGLILARDRGLPTKILCEFRNSWEGPWLLMTRIELPARVHMRHWFFGYTTEDYKDLNINFLALAYIINHMRLSLLIIGQDNDKKLVYNLYDDFVISGINDLFMLRKAHLIEANTTDLLFPSVGEVLESDAGRNRECPFRVLGAWWGRKWDHPYESFCVFPVERNIKLPGYVALFIKPNPFEVNNTAFYATEITTRRPWASTVNPDLMAQANNDREQYNKLKEIEFMNNKKKVQAEIQRRQRLIPSIEQKRMSETKNNIDVQILTTIDQSMTKT